MESNKLISLTPHKNYKAAVYSSIILIMYLMTYFLIVKESLKSNSISAINDNQIFQILTISLWFLVMISIFWAYRIAKQTGREPGSWIFLGLILGPIALLVISLKDYKINNTELKRSILRTREEYKSELGLKKRNNEDQVILSKLKEKYSRLLAERAVNIITKEKIETLKSMIDNGVIDKDIDLNEKERLIKQIEQNKIKDIEVANWSQEWIDNDNVCPACGTQLDKKSKNCLNCGLRVS